MSVFESWGLFGGHRYEFSDGPVWEYRTETTTTTTVPETPDDGDVIPDVDSDPVPEPEDPS